MTGDKKSFCPRIPLRYRNYGLTEHVQRKWLIERSNRPLTLINLPQVTILGCKPGDRSLGSCEFSKILLWICSRAMAVFIQIDEISWSADKLKEYSWEMLMPVGKKSYTWPLYIARTFLIKRNLSRCHGELYSCLSYPATTLKIKIKKC